MTLPPVQLTARGCHEAELLATGGAPLDSFMGELSAERVAAEMRRSAGTLFPILVALSVADASGMAGTRPPRRPAKNDWMSLRQRKWPSCSPLKLAELFRYRL